MAKVAISLPESVLAEIEAAREATGESRSEFMRRAAEVVLKRGREREAVRRYIEGYRRFPETAEEIAFSSASLAILAAENPWEEEEYPGATR